MYTAKIIIIIRIVERITWNTIIFMYIEHNTLFTRIIYLTVLPNTSAFQLNSANITITFTLPFA